MSLSRKHYESFAQILREAFEDYPHNESQRALRFIRNQLAGYFSGDNVRFDGSRFMEACKPEEPLSDLVIVCPECQEGVIDESGICTCCGRVVFADVEPIKIV